MMGPEPYTHTKPHLQKENFQVEVINSQISGKMMRHGVEAAKNDYRKVHFLTNCMHCHDTISPYCLVSKCRLYPSANQPSQLPLDPCGRNEVDVPLDPCGRN